MRFTIPNSFLINANYMLPNNMTDDIHSATEENLK